ncbi:MAG: MFS transporter [Spirochaetia bacterium]|nr:MFS transporter [Spirochaetia bacterium]
MKFNQEIKILIALSFMQFAHIVDFMIMMPLGPQLIRIFHINSSQFGLLVSSYTFAAAISGIFSALFVDRFSRKTALLFVFSGLTAGTFLCAVSPGYEFLLFARVFAGSFGGILNALILSVIGDFFPENRRGRATGIVMSSFSIASVLGVPAGLFLASFMDWHTPFYAIGLLCFAFLPVAFYFLPPINEHLDSEFDHPVKIIIQIFSSFKYITLLFFTFSLMMTVFLIVPYLGPFFVHNTGATEQDLSLIYFFAGLFTFFTSRKIGKLSDQYGKFNLFIIVALISNIPVYFLTRLGETDLYITISVTALFMIFISGRSVPGLAMIAGSVDSKIRGGFLSINSSVQQVTAGIASLIGGMILQEGPDKKLKHFELIGMLAILFCFLSIFIAYWMKKRMIPERH